MNNLSTLLLMFLIAAQTAATVVPTAVEKPADYKYSFPTMTETPPDLGGYKSCILYASDDENDTLLPEEECGKVYDDSIFDARVRVVETFNTVLRAETYPTEEAVTLGKTAVLACDDIFDLYALPANRSAQMAYSGYFIDLGQIKSIDLDSGWWNTGITKSVNPSGNTYLAAPEITADVLDNASVIYFDRGVFGDDFYKLVKENKWTLDRLNRTLAEETLSLDGKSAWSLFVSSGEGIVDMRENRLTVNDIDDRMTKVMAQVAVLIGRKSDTESALMTISTLGKSADFAGQGLLPLPKYSEKDAYVTPVSNPRVISMPIMVLDPLNVGYIADALAYYTRYHADAHLEAILKELRVTEINADGESVTKIKDEDREMAAIVFNTRTLDAAEAFDVTNGFDYERTALDATALDVTFNYLRSETPKFKDICEKINRYFEELAELRV